MKLPFDRVYGSYWIPVAGGYDILFFSKRLAFFILKKTAKGEWFVKYFPIDLDCFDDEFMTGFLPFITSPQLGNVIFIKRK